MTYILKSKSLVANGTSVFLDQAPPANASVYLKPNVGTVTVNFKAGVHNDLWGWGTYTEGGTHYTGTTAITLNSANGDYMEGESYV
jgi:hypothetical protein